MAANKGGGSTLLLVGALGLAGAYAFFRFRNAADAEPGAPGPGLEPPDPLRDTSPPTGKLSKLEIGYV